ncbi:globin domain-containing protein [Hydrogenobacter thermophilus]|uniref:globin domain-containing protein n=1 Tax=Hydrogenobacter thermophilus TaxID=940 RepID=UPI0030FA2D35
MDKLLLTVYVWHRICINNDRRCKMSPEARLNIIKSIPFLQSYGERLTSRMYEILFEGNPELKSMFESDNSTKLAGALLAFAQNLERLNVLESALNKMTLSHVKAGVKPEHYEKVWDALYKAMTEFGISNEIIEAWKEAYYFLAELLIKKEEKLYTCLATSS